MAMAAAFRYKRGSSTPAVRALRTARMLLNRDGRLNHETGSTLSAIRRPPMSETAVVDTGAVPAPHSASGKKHLHARHAPRGGLAALTVGALGVVYGDIGTSPLYAVNEIFFGHGHVTPTPGNVLGCISLVLWALTVVVALKYIVFVLRADNDGEGGVFALYGLLHKYKRRGTALLLAGLMLGAGLV